MSTFDYVTAATDAETTGDAPIEITVDSRKINVYRPTEASLALLFAELADVDTDDKDSFEPRHLGSIVEFFFSLLDASDRAHLKKRLRSRRDKFSLASIEAIFFDMAEAWSGHPTEGLPEPTSPPEPTGPISAPGTPTSI